MSLIASRALATLGELHEIHVECKREETIIGGRIRMKATLPTDPDDLFRCGTTRLATDPNTISGSELVWVSGEMVDLIRQAATSLLPYSFDPNVLPWPSAIVVFEKPVLRFANLARLVTQDIHCVQWHPVTEKWDMLLYERSGDMRLAHCATMIAHKGQDMVGKAVKLTDGGIIETVGDTEQMSRIVCTLWLLLQQRVAVRHTESADRASRRRAMKAGLSEPPNITVIRLRRALNPNGSDGDGRDVDWSHRWMVGGHWRNQYHPSNESHVPTWIAPYVKGPEDKPLVVKDRVYAWTR